MTTPKDESALETDEIHSFEALRCPACTEIAGIPILWGMPTDEALDQYAGKVVYGGCIVPELPEDVGCTECGHRWFATAQPHPGDSTVQVGAEAVILGLLSERLGVALAPARMNLPDGSYVDIDGASEEHAILVEVWAHQGAPRGAQTKKVLTDALKLMHASKVLPGTWKTVLLFSDPKAAQPFQGKSWYAGAIRDLGIGIEVVTLPTELIAAILEAQKKQYR